MLSTSRDWCLPFEILKQVFQNIDGREDLEACLLVCKSQKLAAQEYFKGGISIKVRHATLNRLLDDLPYFGQNVKAIKLRPYKCIFEEEKIKLNWKRVLRLCPNITSVCFLKSSNISPFLEDLKDPDLILNDLLKIETEELGSYSLYIQDLCLQVNIQCPETITSLQLSAVKEEPTTIKYDGLIKLVSQFPHLTCLKVNSLFHGLNLIPAKKIIRRQSSM